LPACVTTPSLRNFSRRLPPPPQNTFNGDHIEVEGGNYIVQSVVLKYRLVRGKYRQDHKRVEVQQVGRFLYNRCASGSSADGVSRHVLSLTSHSRPLLADFWRICTRWMVAKMQRAEGQDEVYVSLAAVL
jgi:hypothetical protein